MVMRYYGNKDGLFAAATHFDLELPDLEAVPRSALGAAAVDHFLRLWEHPSDSDGLQVLLATALTDSATAARMHTIFADQLAPVVSAATIDLVNHVNSDARAGLIATQILGLALCRYVLKIPPVVHRDHDVLVQAIGPVIQYYLTDEMRT